MSDEIVELVRLNERIVSAENAGRIAELGEIVAPFLAFRRRDGTIVGRGGFLQEPRPGNRTSHIESIQLYRGRAVVACLVADGNAVTHNLRLFVKERDRWRLLGWANEPM